LSKVLPGDALDILTLSISEKEKLHDNMAGLSLDGPGIIYVTSKIVRNDVLNEETYLKWYEEDHIPDILDKTPIKSALRFSNINPKADRPYLLMYPMEDLAAIHGEGFKQLKVKSDFMPDKGAPYDFADLDFRDYKLIQKYDPNGTAEGRKPKRVLKTKLSLNINRENTVHSYRRLRIGPVVERPGSS